ncbi:ABC transporter permease [Pseudoxanthobacter sp.]|uniref:ABC transporter permease n=1 Tax=Pseudoxanthobacter sp. TaxID=1925742 RepID=UPI002FDF34C2
MLLLAAGLALAAPFGPLGSGALRLEALPGGLAAMVALGVVLGVLALTPRAPQGWPLIIGLAAALNGAWASLAVLGLPGVAGAARSGFWLMVLASWLGAAMLVSALAALRPVTKTMTRLVAVAVPSLFGLYLFYLWEVIVRGFGVPAVLMPPPSMIAARIAVSLPVLAADFTQTFLKGVLSGYVLGSLAGFAVALVADRVPFLRRGLLPIGNFVSALPIIGIAPIMVMWFGFDWPSKAAVVAVVTFFPMLVNAVAGLSATGPLERDLMRSYGAGWGQTLIKLRLPAALPFLFNALKINSTLALIGAIVAEYFGTPIVGMGFRISIEAGRMALDMVWAEIALAAVAGTLFYGLIAFVERQVTFWHPSYRR